MKFEFDLKDIFFDGEEGADESLEQSIRRQVLNRLTDDYRKRLFSQFDGILARAMEKEIAEAIKSKMPDLVAEILDTTYTPVSRYGQTDEPTTFRTEVVKAITKELVYAPRNYSSEENAFTRAVKSVVEQKTDAIKAEITKAIDVQFKEDAIKFAVAKLAERLGIAKSAIRFSGLKLTKTHLLSDRAQRLTGPIHDQP